ncbi:hypothetical protein Ancab_018996, partial [Ancistrocladus abbreviatus]
RQGVVGTAADLYLRLALRDNDLAAAIVALLFVIVMGATVIFVLELSEGGERVHGSKACETKFVFKVFDEGPHRVL